MPIYEYRCESCGHTLDALQKVSDEHLTDCPSCEEAALKRLISAPAFRLKGSGWYETDFKSDKENKRNLAESPAGGSGEQSSGSSDKPKSDGDKKKETKSEAKKEKKKTRGTGSEAA